MRFTKAGVFNYRNIQQARIGLDAERVFLLGRNGQGKTNFLEALGLATALRPFRTRESKKVIGPRGTYAEVAFEIEHEDFGESSLKARLEPTSKKAWIDGEPIRRVSELTGRFPTVVLSSNDLQLARGSPSVRRRFLDAFLCGIDQSYATALQRYQQGLQERNALLRRGPEFAQLAAFEAQLDGPALAVATRRREGTEALIKLARPYHVELSEGKETLELAYVPNVELAQSGDYAASLQKLRPRDQALGSTSRGPHRDDLSIRLDGRASQDFASEGQQRTIVLALALAIVEYWRSNYGFLPVALADDALGELDGQRQSAFWSMLDDDLQIIASGTRLPNSQPAQHWKVIAVEEGRLQEI